MVVQSIRPRTLDAGFTLRRHRFRSACLSPLAQRLLGFRMRLFDGRQLILELLAFLAGAIDLGVGAILHRPHVVRQGFPLGLSDLLMFLKALLNRLADGLGLHCPCERRLSLLGQFPDLPFESTDQPLQFGRLGRRHAFGVRSRFRLLTQNRSLAAESLAVPLEAVALVLKGRTVGREVLVGTDSGALQG